MKRLCPLFALLFAACGSQVVTERPGGDSVPATSTAGGEADPEVDHPMRTTTPVPVPQPAVAREDLSDPLQRVWTGIEETVAIRPPDGPQEATPEAVQAWADGPFAEWIQRRREATAVVGTTSAHVPEEPVHERALAAALFGYALEDFAAAVRGSPVPAEITEDPELLSIYVQSLTEVLRPIATESVVNYAYCQQRLAPLGDDSEWLPWRAYCVQRGRDVIEVFELQPPGVSAPEEDGGSEEPATDEPADDAVSS